MDLHDKIEALGAEVSDDLKAVLHALANFVNVATPEAVAVETVVAPEDVAPTLAVDAVATAVDKATGEAQ